MSEAKTVNASRIAAIAANAFREAVRDRILYNLILFVLLITASAVFLGQLTGGEEARVIVNLGLGAMLVFGTFISIFVGVGLVWKEIEKRTVYAVFSKPVGRGEFIVGKYLGLCLTLAVNVAVMMLGVPLALAWVGGEHLIGPALTAALLIFFELTITTAVAILFSSFSTPARSALFAFSIFVIGHFSSSLRDLAAQMNSASAKVLFDIVFYVMPNLSQFEFITEAANGIPAPGRLVGFAAIYAVVVLPAIDRQKAVELGEKGIANNPHNWRLFQHLGYTYWRMGDYEKAARTFDAGSAIPGAEPFLRLMAAAMRAKGGSRETARLMYREMYASTDDEQIRTSAERRLWELDWLEEQAIIDRLLEETKQKEGRCAASLRAIMPTLAREVVPPRDFRVDRIGNLVDPSGAPYVLNQADCRVELEWQTSKVPHQ